MDTIPSSQRSAKRYPSGGWPEERKPPSEVLVYRTLPRRATA